MKYFKDLPEERDKYMEKNIELNDKKYIAIGLFVVFLIFGGLFIWSITAKIDTFVVAPGKIIIESYKKPVEYKDWGSVSQIFVKEGDFVKEGQPLLELEKIEADTNYKINTAQYIYLLANRDRLISERNFSPTINFSKEFMQIQDEKIKNEAMLSQIQLFNQRTQKFRETIDYIEEKKKQALENIEGLKDLRKLKISQLKELTDRLNTYKQALSEGLIDKTKVEMVEDKIKELNADIQNIDIRINDLYAQIQQFEKEKELKKKEYLENIDNELKDILAKLEQVKPNVNLYQKMVEKSIIKAPTSGQVMALKVVSIKQVIRPGDVLMYIVPQNDQLAIEVSISPKDRNKVQVGQNVDLHFPSFLSIAANAVDGEVYYVSDDTVFDEIAKTEYYKAKIKITEKGWQQIKKYNFNLQAGMPAVAYIKVRKITPFEYIMQPILMIIKSAFKAT